jgi:hypothetical protein
MEAGKGRAYCETCERRTAASRIGGVASESAVGAAGKRRLDQATALRARTKWGDVNRRSGPSHIRWNRRSEPIPFSMVASAGGHHRGRKGRRISSASKNDR